MAYLSQYRSFGVATARPPTPIVDRRTLGRACAIVKATPYLFPPSRATLKSTGNKALIALINATGAPFDATFADVMGRSRRTPIRQARWASLVAVAEARPLWSIVRLSTYFGLDHTTVLYAFKRLGYAHGRRTPERRSYHVLDDEKDRQARHRACVVQGMSANSRSHKLSVTAVKAIRVSLDEGVDQLKLSRLHRVSKKTVQDIARRKTWRHVP